MNQTPPTGMSVSTPKLPGAGAILSQAWDMFRSRLNSLLTITLVGMLVIFVVGFIFGGSSLFATGNTRGALIGTGAVVIIIVAVIVGIIQQAGLIMAVSSAQPMDWREAYKAGAKRFWPFLGVAVLGGIAIVIGLILLVIPGVILIVWFSLASYAVMLENKGVVESLKQSKAYVSGRFVDVFWRLLVLVVIIIIISIPVSLLSEISQIFGSVLNLAFSVIVTPFAVCYIYILYRALRGETVSPSPTPHIA